MAFIWLHSLCRLVLFCFPTPAPQVSRQDEKQGQEQSDSAHVPILSSVASGASSKEQVVPADPSKKLKADGKKVFVDRRRRRPGQVVLSSDEESEGSEGEGASSEDNLSLLSDSMEEDGEPDVLESLSETGTSGDEEEEEGERSTRKGRDKETMATEDKGSKGADATVARGSEDKGPRGSEGKGPSGSEDKGPRGSEDKGPRGSEGKGPRGSVDNSSKGSDEPFVQQVTKPVHTSDTAEKPKRYVPRRPISLAANFQAPVEESKAVKADASPGHQAKPVGRGTETRGTKDGEEDKTLGRLLQDTRTQAAVHTACRLVAEDGYLLILKCFLDWLQSHPVVIATCAQVTCNVICSVVCKTLCLVRVLCVEGGRCCVEGGRYCGEGAVFYGCYMYVVCDEGAVYVRVV